jgi:hypothetical protein
MQETKMNGDKEIRKKLVASKQGSIPYLLPKRTNLSQM